MRLIDILPQLGFIWGQGRQGHDSVMRNGNWDDSVLRGIRLAVGDVGRRVWADYLPNIRKKDAQPVLKEAIDALTNSVGHPQTPVGEREDFVAWIAHVKEAGGTRFATHTPIQDW